MLRIVSLRRHRLAAVAIVLLMANVAIVADEIDDLKLSKDYFSLSRSRIFVADVPQPSTQSKKLQLSATLGARMTEELVSALKISIPEADISRSTTDQLEGPALLVECYFSRLVPGSKAKRFWVGFGAGKSVLEVSGVIREIPEGRVVAEFTQARLSWCCGFGSNDTEIRQNLALAAEDIAEMVAGRTPKNQAYRWLEAALARPSPLAAPAANATGILRIDSTAPNAEIEVDGEFLGTTPLEVPLAAGLHSVTIRKSGFSTWVRDITVVKDADQSLFADLKVEE
jgi:hypothetical protein